MLPLSELEEFQGNLKELSKVNYKKLRNRIERLGFDAPVFVWKGHRAILDGRQRVRVLRKMTNDGWKLKDNLVPVDEIEAKTKEEAKERLLGYVSQFGKLSDEGLYEFGQGLDWDVVLPDLDLPDFDMDKFRVGYLEDEPEAPEPQIERAEELREKWGVERGQIWQVGRHRVMCGDSGDNQDMVALKSGENIETIVTDPPYDMDAEKVRQILTLWGDRAIILTAQKQAFGLCNSDWVHSIDLVRKRRKPVSLPIFNRPVYYHQNIIGMHRKETSLGWHRPTKEFGSVIEIEGKEYEYQIMGHAKNPELFKQMLLGFKWQKWGDPFLGSGATLIACEWLKKICYGMEIEPSILAVALERFKEGGLEPQRVQNAA